MDEPEQLPDAPDAETLDSAREEAAWLVGARTGEADASRAWSGEERAMLGRALTTAERRTASET